MKQNYKISLCALLLVGAVSTMNAGAQGSGKPTLAVFVVGNMDNTLVSPLAAQLGANLTSGGQYALTSVSTSGKLAELQAAYNAGGGSSIDRNALAAWGRDNGISAICLVIDDVKGNDHMFYAQLIDAKDSKLSGKGSYVRTGVGSGDVSRVALALAKQLSGPEHSRSVPAPTRSYPAELDIEMVFVEGGTFEMGCTAEQGSECGNSEKPAHTVTVGNFYIGKYEVTQAQWKAVMGSNPSANKSDDQRPVEQVAYNDVTGIDGFLAQLNAQTGKNYRLPTEAEWEYAARGGKHKSPYKYSGSDNPNEIAWHVNNSGGQSHVVGGKKPNALGIYDMSGNVWEFCSDCFGTYSASAQTNPTGPSCNESSSHMIRGGYWSGGESLVRVSWRFYVPPTAAYNDGGFRIALPYQ